MRADFGLHAVRATVFSLLIAGCHPVAGARADMRKAEPSLTVSDATIDPVGFWVLETLSGETLCHIAVKAADSGSTAGLNIERCDIPALNQARSWSANAKGFTLVNGAGEPVMAFSRTDIDRFEAVDHPWHLVRGSMS